MDIIANPDTGGWDPRNVPLDVVNGHAREVMGLDGDKFPDITQEEAYHKLKTNSRLRMKVNRAYIQEHHRPATDEEYDNLLKESIGLSVGPETKKKKKITDFNPPPIQYGDWRDISWQ